jgi:hypothetical protein
MTTYGDGDRWKSPRGCHGCGYGEESEAIALLEKKIGGKCRRTEALFGWLKKRSMLMLIVICCERKIIFFSLKWWPEWLKKYRVVVAPSKTPLSRYIHTPK